MKRLPFLAVLAIAGCALGGCITQAGSAAVGALPRMDLGVIQTVTCADLIKSVREAASRVETNQAEGGIGLPNDVAGLRQRNTDLQKQLAQTDAMVTWCETRATSTRVKIDLEAARKQGLRGLLPVGP